MFPIRVSPELRYKGTALFSDFGGMFPYSVGENPYQRVGVKNAHANYRAPRYLKKVKSVFCTPSP